MSEWAKCQRFDRFRTTATLLIALMIGVVSVNKGYALITGGEGNAPVQDPGWPAGAAKIFNDRERIAWWEGPPLGGGQWHAECRGNAQVLNSVLDDFLNLDLKTKRVVVHDGIGQSYWLNPNREAAKRSAAEIDWSFTVWQRNAWERVRKLPVDLRPPDLSDTDKNPPAQIDVYVGGKIRWSDVLVPAGLEVIDERLQAHGFTTADGIVLEGHVIDLATKKPIPAGLRLERVESQPRAYRYTEVTRTIADNQGRWVLKKVPEGWFRLVGEQPGYVPRVVGHARLDGQPGWYGYDCGLARAASLSGRVTDEAGKPLADVTVQLQEVVPEGSTGGYRSPNELLCKTDAEGRFQADQAPAGKARVWLRKTGYLIPGLGPTISIPAKDIVFQMKKSAKVHVTVEFSGTPRPPNYLVEIESERGRVVGSWGGSASIDEHNQILFSDVPPGRYIIQGHPNPSSSSEQTMPITIELKGGESAEVKLSAK